MEEYSIVLLNPPWYKIDEEDNSGFLGCRAGSRWPHMRKYKGSMNSGYQPFPFFLATATAMLKMNGFLVDLHDSIVLGETYDKFYNYLSSRKPNLIVLETSTPSIVNDLELVKMIKKLLPKSKIVMCGIHYQISEISFLKDNTDLDFCIYGEYEFPLLLLAKALRDGAEISSVPNLLYMEDGTVYKNEREKLHLLDEFPWPERSFSPLDYYDGCGGMIGPELQIHTARGCPYSCNFCVWPQLMYSGSYRTRSPEDVVNEIEWYMNKYPYTHFYFDDDTVNADRQHFIKICELLIERGLSKYPWACMGRADLMDDEMLAVMKRAGCYAIKYGMESFDEKVLKLSGKRLNLSRNIEMIDRTEKIGIRVHVTYCLGMLGDTRESVERTVKMSLQMPADSRQYSIATPFPGCKIWDQYIEMGYNISDDTDSFDASRIAVVNQKHLSAEELVKLKNQAEEKNKQMIKERVPSTFRTDDFKNNLLSYLEEYRLIGIIKGVRIPICEFWKKIILDSGRNAELIENHKKNNQLYDLVIVPSRRGSMIGLEKEIVEAQKYSKDILVLFWHGEMKLLTK